MLPGRFRPPSRPHPESFLCIKHVLYGRRPYCEDKFRLKTSAQICPFSISKLMSTSTSRKISGAATTSSCCSSISSPSPERSNLIPIHVIGGGSIGLLYASAIHRSRIRNDPCLGVDEELCRFGCDAIMAPRVTLLMRSHHQQYLKKCANSNNKANHESCWLAPVNVSKARKEDGSDSTKKNETQNCNIHTEIIPQSVNMPERVERDVNKKLLSKNLEFESGISNCASCSFSPPIRCLLLCTKANDSLQALKSIWSRLLPPTSSSHKSEYHSDFHASPAKVVILSNGALAIRDSIFDHFNRPINTQDKRSSQLPDKISGLINENVQLVLATTTHGAYRSLLPRRNDLDNNQYSITHAGEGSTYCTDPEFVDICNSSKMNGETLSILDMNIMLWKKLAVNCVINPLTAIYGVRNGELPKIKHENEGFTEFASNVLEEISLVATKEMEALLSETPQIETRSVCGDNMIHMESIRENLSVPSLNAFLTRVISETSGNISSMLQDVRAGRHTEIHYMNGYVSKLGKTKHNIKCPYNEKLCVQVEKLMQLAQK